MRTKEVVIGNPKRNAVDSTIFSSIAAGDAVGFFEGTVQALDERLEKAEFFWYFIIICKTDDLCDEDFLVLFNPKLLGGKRIDAVTINDEFQSLAREFFKFIKCHPHGKDAGADISGSRDLIFENREGHLVHDEPDIGFNAFDLYVGFIGSQFIGRAAAVGIYERPYDDSSGLGIVIDAFVDTEVLTVFEGLQGMTGFTALP